jgi:hypothetical protein
MTIQRYQKAQDWQPIETAPSYTEVFVIGGEYDFPIAVSKDNCGIWGKLEDGAGNIYNSKQLTHWLPMISRPKTGDGL